jgi:vWA-MoxR associated protein C-terminal domain
MPAEEVARARPEAPGSVSALVVATEMYDDGRYALQDIPGSALVAARFVEWMIMSGVCRPERISFLASYDKLKYADGRYDAELSPEPVITRLKAAGIKIREQAWEGDFTDWISEPPYRPERSDTGFVLFWAGHGHSVADDANERVFLLCSDATSDEPKNVQLDQLIRTVTACAPRADVTAFVQACRYPAQGDYRDILPDRSKKIVRRGDKQRQGSPRRIRALYAAAYGETTTAAEPDGKTFVGAVVDWLVGPARDSGPDAIFGDEFERLRKALKEQGFWPYLTEYSKFGRVIASPPENYYLKPLEWDKLVSLADEIDRSQTPTTGQVRWNAYCRAVGLGGIRHSSQQLATVRDLFAAVAADQPRALGAPPPLLYACDFVAKLADPPRSELIAWCDDWAGFRGGDGEKLLKVVRDVTPKRLARRPYLSITIDRSPPEPRAKVRRPHPYYDLLPVFFATTAPERLKDHGPVERIRILEEAEDVITAALEFQLAARDELVVEFVLPRGLLGWWLEYDHPVLGYNHPIVIRDRERAQTQTVNRQQQPTNGSKPADHIAWLTCSEGQAVTSEMIGKAARSESVSCVVLARGSTGATFRPGDVPEVPAEITEAIANDAPIVVSVYAGKRCGTCFRERASDSIADTCQMLAAKALLTKHVNDAEKWPDPFGDLPLILRKIRDEVLVPELADIKVSVLMQESSRIWAGYYPLESGFSPKGSPLGSGRRG